ncbi:10900_t:CDS:2, partial [Acaulospora colombiana]
QNGKADSSAGNNLKVKGVNFYRDAKKVKFVNMLKGGKAIRNAKGKIVKSAPYQSREIITARVQPDRRWFGNTRVIGQKQLEAFRDSLGAKVDDPYQVLLRQNKLPMSLLADATKMARMHMIDTEPFADTFGPKAQRKRPKLKVGTLEDLASIIEHSLEKYDEKNDSSLLSNLVTDWSDEARDSLFSKGQSKRIWEETQTNLNLTLQRRIYGIHAPVQRLPVLPSSNFGLEILMGKDETIDFEDFLNDPELSTEQMDVHASMEHKLNIKF